MHLSILIPFKVQLSWIASRFLIFSCIALVLDQLECSNRPVGASRAVGVGVALLVLREDQRPERGLHPHQLGRDGLRHGRQRRRLGGGHGQLCRIRAQG